MESGIELKTLTRCMWVHSYSSNTVSAGQNGINALAQGGPRLPMLRARLFFAYGLQATHTATSVLKNHKQITQSIKQFNMKVSKIG